MSGSRHVNRKTDWTCSECHALNRGDQKTCPVCAARTILEEARQAKKKSKSEKRADKDAQREW